MQFDLIIVGGGLAGASLAVALRDTRLAIALIEAAPPHRPQGWDGWQGWDARVYAVSPANAAFLDRIGAWKHLDPSRLTPIQAMQVFGDSGGKIRFSAYESGVPELGWMVESSLMACEFWESIKRQSNLTLFCPAQPQSLSFTEHAAELTLADGTALAAKLIVGADGRDSWVRQQSALTAKQTPYGEKGVVANFTVARPHRNTAYQWFRADGVLAYLPLPGQRISIVWSTPDAHADALCALSPAEFCAEVAAAGQETLGKLELLTAPAAFPLRLLRLPQIVAPRLALLGDAAHGIHPLSGHGINLGFQDASELAAQLAATQPWQDIGELRGLERYQRARKEETLLLQSGTDGLHRLFRSTQPGLKPLRNFGLGLTNHLPIVKSALVRYALGSL